MEDVWDECFGASSDQPRLANHRPLSADATVDELALRPFYDHHGKPIDVPSPSCSCTNSQGGAASLLFVDFPPYFAGPIELARVEEFGGSRGFVALRDVNPGELLLAETPLLAWSDDEPRTALSILQPLLRRPDLKIALCALKHLHPQTTDDVGGHLAHLSEVYAITVSELIPLWHVAVEQGRAPRRSEHDIQWELLRLCIAVQWNAYNMGLFLHASIFNHGCTSRVNCDKRDAPSPDGTVLSEVRATRKILRGEQCFISYVHPLELSRTAVAERLRQFDFGCDCTYDELFYATPKIVSDFAGGKSPNLTTSGDIDIDAMTRVLEKEAQAQLRRAAFMIENGSIDASVQVIRNVLSNLSEVCGKRHLAVAHARRLSISSLRQSLQRVSNEADRAVTVSVSLTLLENALELWYTQRQILGCFHPECVITIEDIGLAINHLLVTDRNALFNAYPMWSTFRLASIASARAFYLHSHIAALYKTSPTNSNSNVIGN